MPVNKIRFIITGLVFIFLFITLTAKVLVIQCGKTRINPDFKSLTRIKKLRGSIKTSDGNTVASSIRGTKLFLKRGKTLSRNELARIQADTGITLEPGGKADTRTLLHRFLSSEDVSALRKIKSISGKIELIPAQKRINFYGHVFSSLCGFTNYEGNGGSGCELSFNEYLIPEHDHAVEVDASGELLISNEAEVLYATGNDVYLTIDSSVQNSLYGELKKAVNLFDAQKGYGLILEPSSGRIIANVYVQKQPYKRYMKIPTISDSFEPGSTFKIIAVSAALEEGLITADYPFFCENGLWEYSGTKPIQDHGEHGWLKVSEIIKYSSNIGVSKIAQKLGKGKLYQYARDFGYGTYTGIKLEGEAKGTLRRIKTWSESDLYCISFGQGVSATPLQIAQSFAVIANNGTLVKLRIIDKIVSPDGKPLFITKTRIIRKNIISESTASIMKDMLCEVIEGGTGSRVKIPGWEICGKTGTAEKYDNSKRQYSEDDFFSSLVGFFPRDDPRFVIFIGVDSPKINHYGGTVCGDAFKNVVKRLIDYYGIPPKKAAGPESGSINAS